MENSAQEAAPQSALAAKRLRVEERLGAIEAQLAALHAALNEVRLLQQQVLQEVNSLQQRQGAQSASVDQLAREVRRGRWLRRIGFTLRLLFWLAVLGAVAYFFVNWDSVMQWFV